MKRDTQLNFGANLGFSHMFCTTCGEERLHKSCRCVSCQTLHTSATVKGPEWADFSVKKYGKKRIA